MYENIFAVLDALGAKLRVLEKENRRLREENVSLKKERDLWRDTRFWEKGAADNVDPGTAPAQSI
jgi:hypothetical protein